MSGDDLSRWLGDAMIIAWADSKTHHCQTQDSNSAPGEKHWSILGPQFFCQLPVKFQDVSQGGHWSSLASLLYNTRHLLVQITALPLCPLEPKGHDSSDSASSRLSLCAFRLLSTQMGLCTHCIYKSACYHMCWDPDCYGSLFHISFVSNSICLLSWGFCNPRFNFLSYRRL